MAVPPGVSLRAGVAGPPCKVRRAAAGGFNVAGRTLRERAQPGWRAPGRVAYRARFMRSARALPTLLVVSLFIAPPARAAWHELEEIPVESPVYHWVEDLASSYPLSRGLLLTRPWTRADVGRFLDQLVADTPAAARDPVVARLRRELEPGGGIDGLEPAFSADLDETSLEISPYV